MPKVLYFNDLRHWYLYALEPPLSMADVVLPVTEIAGCGVDSLCVQVDGGSGLWYPSKVGRRHLRNAPVDENGVYTPDGVWSGDGLDGDIGSIRWRAWQSLATLEQNGVDLLAELIREAHAQDMELHASLRMGVIPDMDPAWNVLNGGKGLGEPAMMDYQLAVLTELIVDWGVDGVELDFACPGGTAWFFPQDEGATYSGHLTELLRAVAEVARGHSTSGKLAKGSKATIGVHIYPTLEMNTRHGIDIQTWIDAGLCDWVMVSYYPFFGLDCDMDLDWLTNMRMTSLGGSPKSRPKFTEVIGRINPWIRDGSEYVRHYTSG